MRRISICCALLCFALIARIPAILAGDAGADVDKLDKEKKKPKEKPFRVSAWCAFKELPYNPITIKPPDPNAEPTYETRLEAKSWSGYARRGQWVSIVVELENTTTDTTYHGSVTLNTDAVNENQAGQIPYKTNYRKDFEIAPKAAEADPPTRQQLHFSVLCKEDWSEGSETLNVDITAGSQFQSRLVTLNNLDASGDDFIVVVTEGNAGAFRDRTNKKRSGLNVDDELLDAHFRPKSVATVSPKELPRRWHDLTMANLIVIDGPPAEKFEEDQLEALRCYVQAGGHVMLMAGEDPSRVRGFWEDFAGINVKGMANIKSIDEINPPYDGGKNWQMTVMDVEVRQDARRNAVIKRNHGNGCVEMCRRFYGAGSVTFLPFSLVSHKNDVDFVNWPGFRTIPNVIVERSAPSTLFGQMRQQDLESAVAPRGRNWWGVQQTPALDRTSLIELRKDLDRSFSNDTPVQMQKSATVLSFLMMYLLFAVPGNYFLFGWFRRREIAWLAVPVWAATFSVIAYVVGYLGQTGKLTVNELSVVEMGPREDIGVARTFFGIYAPTRDDYQVEFPPMKVNGSKDLFDVQAAPGHLVNLDPDAARADYPPLALIDTDSGILIDRMLVQQRSTRRLEIVHRAKLGDGVDVRVRPNAADDGALDIQIENNTGYTLINPVFVKDVRSIELGTTMAGAENTLPPGGTNKLQSVGGTGPAWKLKDKEDPFFGRPFGAMMGKQVATRSKDLQSFLRDRVSRFHEGAVCAWIQDAPLPVKIYNSSSHRTQMDIGKFEGLTLLLVPVAVQHGGQSSSKAVRSGAIPLKYSANKNMAQSPEANNPNWQTVSGGTVPLTLAHFNNNGQSNDTNGAVVAVEFNAPEDRAQLHYDGCFLRMTFKVVVAAGAGSDLEAPTAKILNGNAIVSVEKLSDDDGAYHWDELSNMMVNDLKAGKPFKSDPIEITLGLPKLVRDGKMRVLIKIETPGVYTPLQVKDLEVRVTDE